MEALASVRFGPVKSDPHMEVSSLYQTGATMSRRAFVPLGDRLSLSLVVSAAPTGYTPNQEDADAISAVAFCTIVDASDPGFAVEVGDNGGTWDVDDWGPEEVSDYLESLTPADLVRGNLWTGGDDVRAAFAEAAPEAVRHLFGVDERNTDAIEALAALDWWTLDPSDEEAQLVREMYPNP